MAPDGDPGVVFRSKPLFLKSVVSDFKSKHIPPPRWLPFYLKKKLFRPGSFLSPGPSNSKATVAGSPSFRPSNVFPFVRRRLRSATNQVENLQPSISIGCVV